MKKTFIIIPCFNEKEVIRNTLLPLMALDLEVVLIDDGSKDDILCEVKDLELHYLKHPVNLGQGAALQTGMDYALKNGADYVVHFDADGQHRLEDIEHLLTPLFNDECDITLGTRFLDENSIREIPTFKRLLLKMARVVNGAFTGIWMSDAHNGFRAMNRKAIQSIRLEENNMVHATEIIQQIKTNQLRYKEVSIQVIYSEYAKKKGQSPLNAISIFIDLILKKLL